MRQVSFRLFGGILLCSVYASAAAQPALTLYAFVDVAISHSDRRAHAADSFLCSSLPRWFPAVVTGGDRGATCELPLRTQPVVAALGAWPDKNGETKVP